MTDEKHKSIVNSEEGINECILQKNEWFVNGRQNQWNQSLWNGKMPSHPITLCNDLDRKKLAAEKLHLTKSGRNLCRFESLYLMLVMVYHQPSTTELPATLTTPYYLKTPWKLKSCLPPNQGKTVLNTIILVFVNYHFTAWRHHWKQHIEIKATESHSLTWEWWLNIVPILQLPRKFYEYIFFEFQREFLLPSVNTVVRQLNWLKEEASSFALLRFDWAMHLSFHSSGGRSLRTSDHYFLKSFPIILFLFLITFVFYWTYRIIQKRRCCVLVIKFK